MEPKTNPRDEYLHTPPEKRLWNESYFFDFNDEQVRGFSRMGFMPFERKANVWFYVVYDGEVYWYRNERVPIDDCFGLHVDAGEFTQTYELLEPYEAWSLSASGDCRVSSDPEAVLLDAAERVPLEAELTLDAPLHEALDIDLLVDTQHHYDHAGTITGTIELDGESIEVDGVGYRDHSWGWFRDWTPGEWGHNALFAQFDTGDCFTLIASTNPSDEIHHVYGYHANEERARPIRDASVAWNDGLERGERAETWARGDYPTVVVFTLEFDDGTERLSCEPVHNVPIGFEDRNWALTDPDGPWLTSIINRMPATCTWRSNDGYGWPEELLAI